MLKTPTETNWVQIHFCVRKRNFLHNSFILSTCNGSKTLDPLERRQKLAYNVCSCSSAHGEHEQESMLFDQIFMFKKHKKINQLHTYCGDPMND